MELGYGTKLSGLTHCQFLNTSIDTYLSVLCWTSPEYVTDFAGAEAVLSGKKKYMMDTDTKFAETEFAAK